MSIVTRTGDKGMTGLFGGTRMPKSASRIHAYGTVDELNAVLGIALAEKGLADELSGQLVIIQKLLFRVGADLATPRHTEGAKRFAPSVLRMTEEPTKELEGWITPLEASLPLLTRFILPSGSRLGSLLHLARTVCRRAERWVVALSEQEEINPHVQIYLNRLSDYLFLAARKVNRESGAAETEV